MLTYGERIQMIRAGKGMTQVRLAQASGVPQGALSNIERGKRDFTISTLCQLSAALGVSPAAIFDRGPVVSRKNWATRERIERLARAAWGDQESLDDLEKKTVKLLRDTIPMYRAKKSSRRVQSAWTSLKNEFTDAEIKIMIERVRDEEVRRIEKKSY